MADTRPTIPLPNLADDDPDSEQTALQRFVDRSAPRRPYLVRVSGAQVGQTFAIEEDVVEIGRGTSALVRIDEVGVSRVHARLRRLGPEVVIEDAGSANGTFVNGRRIQEPTVLKEGDKVQC
ncbi:MAG TPA: FHA domain-containing protein, partial [Labilithrix sp.]